MRASSKNITNVHKEEFGQTLPLQLNLHHLCPKRRTRENDFFFFGKEGKNTWNLDFNLRKREKLENFGCVKRMVLGILRLYGQKRKARKPPKKCH